MPTVHFVQEHVTVEAKAGQRLSDLAAEHGILVCRELLGWTKIGDYSVWVQGEPGSVNPPTLGERLRRVGGTRRLANHVRVLGDLTVWTQQGLGSRNGGNRPIDSLPQPIEDETQRRTVQDAAGTAQYPLGHPLAVGRGKMPPAEEAAADKGADDVDAKKAAALKAAEAKKAAALKAAEAKKAAAAKAAEDKKAEAAEPEKKAEAAEPEKKAEAAEPEKKAEAAEPEKKAGATDDNPEP